MTDEDLARFLGCDVALAKRLSPYDRARYERFALEELAVKLYLDGKGPRPPGVILCGRQRRKS